MEQVPATPPTAVAIELWGGAGAADDDSALVWLCPDGALVDEGQLIAEVLVDKATVELHAPTSGRLHILAAPVDAIGRGQLVAMID